MNTKSKTDSEFSHVSNIYKARFLGGSVIIFVEIDHLGISDCRVSSFFGQPIVNVCTAYAESEDNIQILMVNISQGKV